MRWEFGLHGRLLIRREQLNLGLGLRILYASDLHLRVGQGHLLGQELVLAARAQRPDAILLGGDLVDSQQALPHLENLVSELESIAPVGAVSGNHDVLAGRDAVRASLRKAGGRWLESESMTIGDLTVAGSLEARPSRGLWILCAHYPTVFPQARKAGAKAVLAGHLHGWQIVLGQWGEYLLPGALLSRWNGLRFERDGCTLLVSRGMTDLFPLRCNCPREILDLRL